VGGDNLRLWYSLKYNFSHLKLTPFAIYGSGRIGAKKLRLAALGHAGLTKFDRLQKRKRFWGARTSLTRGALCEMARADGGYSFQPSCSLQRRLPDGTAAKKIN